MPAARPATTLVTRTVEIPDPGDLPSLLPESAVTAWVRRGEGMVGIGEALALDLPSRIDDGSLADAWRAACTGAIVKDDVRLPGTGLVAFVSAPFSATSPAGAVLRVPRTVVGRRDGRAWVTSVSVSGIIPPADPRLPVPEPVREPGMVSYADGARSAVEWMEAVGQAVQRISAGDLDKVVLARDLEARAEARLDVRHLLNRLAAAYPSCWTFTVDGLVGATPELLVRAERGLVTSRVLAGTVGRTGNDEPDLAHAAALARSSKDLEEHEYAVRSVAEALAPHCDSMNVPESPFVLHLPNVMHLATDVTGVLKRHRSVSLLDLAAGLHPSAAVCGTPRADAAALIDRLEGMDRDRYAGPVGWVDACGDGELGIALRSGRIHPRDPHRIRVFAGCGIVAGSDPQAELAESDAKLRPMRDALG